MQHKLTLSFIGFALIPLLIVLQWAVTYIGRDQNQNLSQDTIQLVEKQIFLQTQERVRDLESISLSEVFWESKKNDLDSMRLDFKKYSDALMFTHPDYRLIMLVNEKGRVLTINSKDSKGNPLDTNTLLGKSFDRSSWFQKALSTKGVFIESPRELEYINSLYAPAKSKYLPVVKSIRNEMDEVKGVWVIFVEASFLTDILNVAALHIETPYKLGVYDGLGNPLAEIDTFKKEPLENIDVQKNDFNFLGQNWTVQAYIQETPLVDYLSLYLWPAVAAFGLILLYAFVAARRFVIPLQRLVCAAELILKGNFSFGVPYAERTDEYGRLSRALSDLQKLRLWKKNEKEKPLNTSTAVQETAQKLEDTTQLIHSLSAQANMLALNASMEAVKSHHLDEVAEKANDLAQKTSYSSQELLKKLNEIKVVCDEIQNQEKS
ncbi:MAG: hypothetical protein KBB83_00160 [Alphaproteobacteria bacterium]|nr:hypothetical protein [Alphaproteobacteria bacterium]